MSAALQILSLWVAFAATHRGLSSLRGLRELSPLAVGIGVLLTVAIGLFHGTLFGP